MDRQTPVLTSDEFGKFFSEYKNRFVSIAYGYVHDTDIAKDIVTDSFMYLWEHREQVNMAENIKGYIYFCVRTRCANHIKEQEVLRRAKNEITKDAYWKLQSSLPKNSSSRKSSNCSAGNSPKCRSRHGPSIRPAVRRDSPISR